MAGTVFPGPRCRQPNLKHPGRPRVVTASARQGHRQAGRPSRCFVAPFLSDIQHISILTRIRVQNGIAQAAHSRRLCRSFRAKTGLLSVRGVPVNTGNKNWLSQKISETESNTAMPVAGLARHSHRTQSGSGIRLAGGPIPDLAAAHSLLPRQVRVTDSR